MCIELTCIRTTGGTSIHESLTCTLHLRCLSDEGSEELPLLQVQSEYFRAFGSDIEITGVQMISQRTPKFGHTCSIVKSKLNKSS